VAGLRGGAPVVEAAAVRPRPQVEVRPAALGVGDELERVARERARVGLRAQAGEQRDELICGRVPL